ncbi:MAG: DinB family protein [Planctomycetota bacterium]
MKYSLEQALEILVNTPTVLRAIFAGLSDPWICNTYGDKTFSPFDVVGHLIHGEKTDWMTRAKIILQHGESRPFDPYDRYAQYQAGKGKTIAQLLDEFEALRRSNIETLRGLKLSEPDLDRRGTHQALGTVTMRQLLATWVTHDLNHVAQICKAMAFQYREEVGAWLRYVSILKPPSPAD